MLRNGVPVFCLCGCKQPFAFERHIPGFAFKTQTRGFIRGHENRVTTLLRSSVKREEFRAAARKHGSKALAAAFREVKRVT